MSFWKTLFGSGAPARGGASTAAANPLMTVAELIGEGRRLQRDCVLLTPTGTGEPAAVWHHAGPGADTDPDREPWLSIATRFVPGFESAAAPFVTISTRLEDMTGRVDVIDALPAGLPLHAHRVEILPPIEGVFALGGERVAAWLRANGWERTQRYGPGFPDRALVEAYERVWFEEYPVYGGHPDAWAMLGGWHLPGADDDWYELLPQRLIALTLRDSEPWVEAWQRPDGGLHVIQRIT